MFTKILGKYQFWKLPHERFPEIVFWEKGDILHVSNYVNGKYGVNVFSGDYKFLKVDEKNLMFSRIDPHNSEVFICSIKYFNKFRNKSYLERLSVRSSYYENVLSNMKEFLKEYSDDKS